MKTVLLVDDLQENRYLLKSILQANHWQVTEAAGGQEALDSAHRLKPDLVISDVLMPGMDGFSLCRAWKQDAELKGVPFVFCTATFTDEMDGQLARELGADAFIPQPVQPDALLACLRSLEEKITAGEPVHLPAADASDETVTRHYAAVLAQKLDHKVMEYRQTIARLEQSKQQLEEGKRDLGKRVRELTFLHELNNLTNADGEISALLGEIARELPTAFQHPESTFARIQFAGGTFASEPFRQTGHRLAEVMSGPDCAGSEDGIIEVFVEPNESGSAPVFLDEEGLLLKTTGNILCLELQRRATKQKLEHEERTASALLHLSNTGDEKSEREVIQEYLETAVELTGSRLGCAHLVSEDQEILQLAAVSKSALTGGEPEAIHCPLSRAGGWADCLRTRAPVVHDDYPAEQDRKGLPSGLAPLTRHLGVPVLDQDRVRMILGVGNREQPYGERQVVTLQLVTAALWRTIDRKRREEKLLVARDRLALLQTALEAASHTVMITDAQGTIEWVNPAFTRDTGYAAGEAIGQNSRILKSGKHAARFYENLWQTITAGRVWHGTFVNKRKDGTFLDEDASITPVRNAAGEIAHFIAIKQDVTQKHEMEKRLLRSQRMESIGLLAGGVAHDLNNVLAPILMAVEMLKEDLPAADRNEIVNTLETNCERGAGIIRQVLTFARGVEGRRVLVQLRHLAKDMVQIARETFPPNITLRMDVPASLWPTVGDATQLHQILLNLFVNARDALPEGGEIAVSGTNDTLTEARHFQGLEIPPGRYAHLRVADNGAGMSREVMERIFEPFFTTKAVGKGTGLGLATVLGIVRSHKGLIEVNSGPGEGTQFHIYLPVADEIAELAARPASTPPSGHGQTILLVDDEPAVLNVTGKILKKHNYQVIEAADGAQAVARYAQSRDAIALVLTDIMMPIMDGVALTRALRTINPQVKIVGSSGFVGDAGKGNRLAELHKLGVKSILEKPYTFRELLATIAEEIQG